MKDVEQKYINEFEPGTKEYIQKDMRQFIEEVSAEYGGVEMFSPPSHEEEIAVAAFRFALEVEERALDLGRPLSDEEFPAAPDWAELCRRGYKSDRYLNLFVTDVMFDLVYLPPYKVSARKAAQAVADFLNKAGWRRQYGRKATRNAVLGIWNRAQRKRRSEQGRMLAQAFLDGYNGVGVSE